MQQFSKSSFLEAHRLDPSSRDLADKLAAEVQQAIHDVIRAKLHDLVESLNQCGHSLRLYEPPEPGIISYRDDAGDYLGYRCALRLAVDTVVSVGFQDTIDYSPEDEENPQ